MREISFRGKRKDSGEWLFGDLVRINGNAFIFPDPAPDGFERYIVNPETIGQYSGIDDATGAPIFEGDVVQTPERIGVCEFINGMFVINDHNPDSPNTWSDPAKWSRLGNFHENPELLK